LQREEALVEGFGVGDGIEGGCVGFCLGLVVGMWVAEGKERVIWGERMWVWEEGWEREREVPESVSQSSSSWGPSCSRTNSSSRTSVSWTIVATLFPSFRYEAFVFRCEIFRARCGDAVVLRLLKFCKCSSSVASLHGPGFCRCGHRLRSARLDTRHVPH
jgi:hypothetical protein